MVYYGDNNNMSKTIINGSNDFFEMDGKEGDVLYSFTGNCSLTKDSMLYGKTVNLSEMYDIMLDDVREFLFGGEFVSTIDKIAVGKAGIPDLVSKYTVKKYSISIERVYNKIRGNLSGTTMTVDTLFNELKVKYGITGIDWMYLYNNVNNFYMNDVDILEYMGNRILSNDIHEYFVTEYNLRTVGVVKKMRHCINKNNVSVGKSSNYIKIEWNNRSRNICLSDFVRSYKQWWRNATCNTNSNRGDIRDYDLLLNGRNVTEVFPKYCPVFSNLRMNYTGIDFGGKNNIRKCSEIAGYSEKGETWSAASIDRIDSNKGYSYDNIRIISQYANNLKNVGNIDQMRRLVRYMDEQNSYL
jgi:hypothetical protein